MCIRDREGVGLASSTQRNVGPFPIGAAGHNGEGAARGDALGLMTGQSVADFGSALTGNKPQVVTTSRTFTVVTGSTDREWAYVALSRGRQANTLYLANPEAHGGECIHLTHQDRRDPLDAFAASLDRSRAQTAAIDHLLSLIHI